MNRFTVFFIVSIMMCFTTDLAAQDWANLNRFKSENLKIGLPKENEDRVVFMGNSITEGWIREVPEFFAGRPYINRGISGQTTPQMLIRFRQDVIKLQPKVVVILAGTNDIAGNTGPSTLEMIEDNLYSMTELAQFHGIRVVLCSVLPAADYPWRPGLNPAPKIVELNRRIKEYAQKHHAIYCDYFSAMADENNGLPKKFSEDGVHPNKEGYAIMAPLVESAISEALKIPSIKVGDIGT
ncbi:MAG: SGNH/GDSL hydrolase family protein [Dysgonamonadaceae bacterium]|jgi:lysophospholipase L1-like esterase